MILTGTPAGVGAARTPPRWLVDGDVVEITIAGVGTLQQSRRAPIARDLVAVTVRWNARTDVAPAGAGRRVLGLERRRRRRDRRRALAVARAVNARPFAALDVEEYIDFQAARPTVELVDGVVRNVAWPSLDVLGAARRRARAATSSCCSASNRTCAGVRSATT